MTEEFLRERLNMLEEGLRKHIDDDFQRHVNIISKVSELSAKVAVYAAIGSAIPSLLTIFFKFIK